MTLGRAREILAARGPVSLDKMRAAELVNATARIEPAWWCWLIADVTVALLLVGATAHARWLVVLYAAAYAFSVARPGNYGPEARHILVVANAHLLANSPVRPPVPTRFRYLTAGVFLTAGVLMVILPLGLVRVIGTLFAVFIARHTWRLVASHLRARHVLEHGPQQPWWPTYVADRDQRETIAYDLLRDNPLREPHPHRP